MNPRTFPDSVPFFFLRFALYPFATPSLHPYVSFNRLVTCIRRSRRRVS